MLSQPLDDNLAKLTHHWQRIAMIAGLCERHSINHQLYCENFGKDTQAQQYRKILNKVWEYLAGQLKSLKNLEKALLELEVITPEPQPEDGYGVYPALDACCLLTSCLQMILDPSADDLDTASGMSMGTVAQFIALIDELDEFDPSQQQHALFDEEIALQLEIAQRLQTKGAQPEIIKTLRRWLNEMNSSNLGISLQ
jgi:uncharacterized protein YjaG (DUF416 family)